jgi:hypothetical protein
VRLAPNQNRPWITAVVAVAAVATGAACVSATTGLGAMPTHPRPASALVCQQEVCLWPEDSEALAANRDGWRAVRAAWTGLGLPLPAKARIGPVATGGLLAITTTATDVDSAQASMTQLLPRALAGCLAEFDDEGRNERFDRLSVLLHAKVAGGEAEPGAITVPDPQPVAGDAESLWRAAGRCGA